VRAADECRPYRDLMQAEDRRFSISESDLSSPRRASDRERNEREVSQGGLARQTLSTTGPLSAPLQYVHSWGRQKKRHAISGAKQSDRRRKEILKHACDNASADRGSIISDPGPAGGKERTKGGIRGLAVNN